LYDFNLDAMKDLNLSDDEDFDENDPELNAQLAAMMGGEALPSYSPNKTISPQQNPINRLPATGQPIQPVRPAPTYQHNIQPSINQSLIDQQQSLYPISNQPILIPSKANNSSNCLILDNSHFVGDQNPPLLIPEQANESNVSKEQLIKWKDEFKTLAIDAKRNSDLDTARAYLKKMKDVENAIESLNSGQLVDLSSLGPPSTASMNSINHPKQITEQSSSNDEPVVSLLEALLQRKQKLESSLAKEKAANNESKVRMLNRLLKQFDSAIKANKAGKSFDYSSLPDIGMGDLPSANVTTKQAPSNKPVSSINQPIRPPPPSIEQQKPVQTSKSASSTSKEQLIKWKDEFKSLALSAKRNDDLDGARAYLKKMKEVDLAIECLDNGQPVDFNSISRPDNDHMVNSNDETTNESTAYSAPSAEALLVTLNERKAKFQSSLEKEQAANNSPKVRMITRVLKQYDQAIKACKLGKEFEYETLPPPHGFEELAPFNSRNIKTTSTMKAPQEPPKQSTSSKPAAVEQPVRPKPPFKRTISVNNKQMDYLLQRQKLFKEAAVESNKRGDTTQALDYLRKSKGFEPLIIAVSNGLPIDVSNIPVPPQLGDDDFVLVSRERSSENLNLDLETEEHYRKLELELQKQIELCNKNKEHFYKIGDVSTGTKFEKYLIDMKKDFEVLMAYKKRGDPVPKYHYELKEFSIVVCNTELSNNEVLFEIIRAIDLPCKQPIDSYVKFEFPFPKESPQQARTHSAKNTLYPEYEQSFKFPIDRKARSLARIFGKSIKMEIYSKGGFFKSDELIGYINVDLSSLKKKCTIFDSFPIIVGRKEVGGKLQIKIKLREPLLAKQVEEIKEKWLVFTYK